MVTKISVCNKSISQIHHIRYHDKSIVHSKVKNFEIPHLNFLLCPGVAQADHNAHQLLCTDHTGKNKFVSS